MVGAPVLQDWPDFIALHPAFKCGETQDMYLLPQRAKRKQLSVADSPTGDISPECWCSTGEWDLQDID